MLVWRASVGGGLVRVCLQTVVTRRRSDARLYPAVKRNEEVYEVPAEVEEGEVSPLFGRGALVAFSVWGVMVLGITGGITGVTSP